MSTKPSFLFLEEEATAGLLTMAEVVAVCEAVLLDQGKEKARLSQPAAMFLAGDQHEPTQFKVKGGYLPGLDSCGFRVVGDVGPDGLIAERHFCLLLDPATAEPRALVAQTEMHRMRTAACGLVALKHLAGRSETVALIGAGRIGRWFATGFHDVFPDKKLLIGSRRIETAIALAAQLGTASCPVEAATVDDAAAQADAIVTLTSAPSPVLSADAFRPGMTIIGMGEHHELPFELLRRADRFVVDDLGFASTLGSLAAWLARGEVDARAAGARVDATLAAVVAKHKTGRRSEQDMVLAIVQGLAIADLAIAETCRRRAQAETHDKPIYTPKEA